jgi:hypothetical protein
MKKLLQLLVGLCLIACAASASAALSPVSFVIGKQQFKAGDCIMIDQVLTTSARLEVGAKVVVRGHCQLASAAKANVGLFLTHRSPAKADESAQSQVATVRKGSGSFELACEIKYEGDIHVSFYPESGGDAFGGVYFSVIPE